MVRSIGWGVAIAAFVVTHAQAGLITVSRSETWVTAFSGTGAQSGPNLEDSTLIPKSTSVIASIGANSSNATIDFFHQGAGSVLNWDFSQTRSGTPGAGADIQIPVLTNRFTVSADTTYQLSGYFQLTGSGLIRLDGILIDATAGTELFYNLQLSENQVNKTLTLGQTAGNSINELRGSMTGNLIAGHEYWIGSISNLAALSAGGGASAVGSFRLEVGDLNATEPVPEPSSCALTGFGVTGIMLSRWRRRKAVKAS